MKNSIGALVLREAERKIAALTAELDHVRGERNALNAMAPCDSCRAMYQEVCSKLAAAEAEHHKIKLFLDEKGVYVRDGDDLLTRVDELFDDYMHSPLIADGTIDLLSKERDALREQVARLEADGKRLDWLEDNHYHRLRVIHNLGNGKLREAIDAALTETKEPIKK